MERVRVLENVFTVMSVSLFIVLISEISIAGAAMSAEILKANMFSLLFAVVFMTMAFAMNLKRKNNK